MLLGSDPCPHWTSLGASCISLEVGADGRRAHCQSLCLFSNLRQVNTSSFCVTPFCSNSNTTRHQSCCPERRNSATGVNYDTPAQRPQAGSTRLVKSPSNSITIPKGSNIGSNTHKISRIHPNGNRLRSLGHMSRARFKHLDCTSRYIFADQEATYSLSFRLQNCSKPRLIIIGCGYVRTQLSRISL